jgi:hypothetical protein
MSRMREPKLKGKSYDIPKRLLWDAWLKVKENVERLGPTARARRGTNPSTNKQPAPESFRR